jgi:hypothetical protein
VLQGRIPNFFQILPITGQSGTFASLQLRVNLKPMITERNKQKRQSLDDEQIA